MVPVKSNDHNWYTRVCSHMDRSGFVVLLRLETLLSQQVGPHDCISRQPSDHWSNSLGLIGVHDLKQ